MHFNGLELKPHQEYGLQENRRLYSSGAKGWCVTGPCGSGKSLQMFQVAIPAAKAGKTVFIHTHRIMLTHQLMRNLTDADVRYGVIAASASKEYYHPDRKLQICSTQTVASRINNLKYNIPMPDIVLVDEAHAQNRREAVDLFKKYQNAGAKIIGYSATPVDLDRDIYHGGLVYAGSYQDMLDCKLHLPCVCFGPDRPDLSQLKPMAGGDFSSEDDKRVNRVPTIFGRVYEYWTKLNPFALPAMGFAPDVGSSKWFLEEFKAKGVPCAHIDAQMVILTEKNSAGVLETREYAADSSVRQAVLDGSKEGKYKIVWNRWVLREAIDCPWIFHCILATSIGSVASYIQICGRVLRYFPGYEHVIIQDHGGCIDRHGAPNIERNWTLGCTSNSIHNAEVEERRKNQAQDAEPICCPVCCAYRLSGPQCHNCGYMHKKSIRIVRQLNGELVRKAGRVIPYKAPKPPVSKDQKSWDSYYWRSKKSKGAGMTFNQVVAMFTREHGYPPPKNLNNMPKDELDWSRRVKDVKYGDLIQGNKLGDSK